MIVFQKKNSNIRVVRVETALNYINDKKENLQWTLLKLLMKN